MTDQLRQAAMLALDALLLPTMKTQQMLIQRDKAIIALRRALGQQAEPVAVTREMISAAHAVTMKHNEVILSASMLERIYMAMDQAAMPSKTPFDVCPTCEALARTVMCDNVGNDTNWEHTARLLDAALQELIVFVDERWGDNECRPLENAKHALGLVKDQE